MQRRAVFALLVAGIVVFASLHLGRRALRVTPSRPKYVEFEQPDTPPLPARAAAEP